MVASDERTFASLWLTSAMSRQFAIIPQQQELEQIERDLRFHPTTNPNPRHLTPTQIEQFNREGYIARLRIFDEREIGKIRGYFDALLARVLAAGGDSYSISSAHL